MMSAPAAAATAAPTPVAGVPRGAQNLFAGAESLRVRGERVSLWSCILLAPAVIALASLIFPGVSMSEFILLIVGGMLFVSISRGRLLGSSIRIEGRQLPEIAEVAESVAKRIGLPAPQIFVRDDPFVPISSAGIGEPYSLVISSQYYEHLRRGELAFLIARELGHIAAGHTRLTSLLSASGRENPVVALVFGAWLRKTEYTADRVGLLCCDSLDEALGAISITTFHSIGRRVDMRVLAEQRRELDADPTLRMGEWITGVPYATNRLDALRAFAASPLASIWQRRLRDAAAAAPDGDAAAIAARREDEGSGTVTKRECAPLFRRVAAVALDLAVLDAIFKTALVVEISDAVTPSHAASIPAFLRPLLSHVHVLDPFSVVTIFALFAYSAILVGFSGQTLGMMIMELRVVTTTYGRPTLVQSFWRYTIGLCCLMSALVLLGLFARIQLHDRLSRTRLIRGRKLA
jgi:Zn-dependent protease with chaperone function/uncharacterized RDD family membrane protein YckC